MALFDLATRSRPRFRLSLRAFLAAAFIAAAPVASAVARSCDIPDGAHRVYVRDFHAAADGKTDDGPAIRAALASAMSGPKPATVEFEQGKTYRISSFDETYAVQLLNAHQVTLRGNGAELLLLPPNKVMHIENSSDIGVFSFRLRIPWVVPV